MVIYKFKCSVSGTEEEKPIYIVTDTLANADDLIKKHYPHHTILNVDLISDKVINLWAQ